jgi:hypothetical protein
MKNNNLLIYYNKHVYVYLNFFFIHTIDTQLLCYVQFKMIFDLVCTCEIQPIKTG